MGTCEKYNEKGCKVYEKFIQVEKTVFVVDLCGSCDWMLIGKVWAFELDYTTIAKINVCDVHRVAHQFIEVQD